MNIYVEVISFIEGAIVAEGTQVQKWRNNSRTFGSGCRRIRVCCKDTSQDLGEGAPNKMRLYACHTILLQPEAD